MSGNMARMMGQGDGKRSMDFKGSSKRLLRQLAPEKGTLYVMVVAAVLSVALSVVGPKILGKATDLVRGRRRPTDAGRDDQGTGPGAAARQG